jgi:1-acyl-sn-glycerol-3-phosphate acyltransferase
MSESVRPSGLEMDEGAKSPQASHLSIVIRSTIYNIAFYINIVVLMVGGLPSVLMGRRAAMYMARLWARTSVWLLEAICGTRLEFRGLDRIPKHGVVIAAKHQSIFETFALVIHVPDFAYVFKRELNWIPLFGWYLMAVEQIAINRSSGSTALTQVTNGVAKFLKSGRAIFIFPEGTRRPVGAPPRYKHGVSHLYSTLNASVMPVALNTGVFWPRRSFLRKPGLAVIEFLPVIEPGLPKDEFAQLLQDVIETRTDALVAEAYRADPSLRTSEPEPTGS